jgi:hypothetical protein
MKNDQQPQQSGNQLVNFIVGPITHDKSKLPTGFQGDYQWTVSLTSTESPNTGIQRGSSAQLLIHDPDLASRYVPGSIVECNFRLADTGKSMSGSHKQTSL